MTVKFIYSPKGSKSVLPAASLPTSVWPLIPFKAQTVLAKSTDLPPSVALG
jgi:hypothetical protein